MTNTEQWDVNLMTESPSETLLTARRWRAMGQSVIPIKYKDKRPDLFQWEPYKETLPTDTELVNWFSTGDHNIGIITGVNNLVVLDFDDEQTYAKFVLYSEKLSNKKRFDIHVTYKVRSARGWHIYFYLPYPQRNLHVKGLDIKGKWGYVLTPPSVHPSGVRYSADNPRATIARIEALSDILPASLLARDVSVPMEIRMPLPLVKAVQIEADPWQSAQQAGEPNQSAVEKIKKKYDIKSFFTDIERTSLDGRYYLTRCPLHDDHNPSMWIDTTLQVCGCYSGCTDKPLDVINLFARLNGLSNSDAIKIMVKGN